MDGSPNRRLCGRTTILNVVSFLLGAGLCLLIFYLKDNYHLTDHISEFVKNTFSKPKEISPQAEKHEFIKQMVRRAWNAYEQHGWGEEAIKPISGTPFEHPLGQYRKGLFIVQSLSTLHLLGLKEEYTKGRQWIKLNLLLNLIRTPLTTPDAVTQYIGPLLSCYALTNDSMFRDKAKQMSELIKPAYNRSEKELPHNVIINLLGDVRYEDRQGSLAEYGSQDLELRYLSYLTEDDFWMSATHRIRDNLKSYRNSHGLYRNQVYKTDPFARSELYSLQTNDANHFFGYLIKAFIMSNGTDEDALETYLSAIQAAVARGYFPRSAAKYTYLRDRNNRGFENDMYFEGCNLGAVLALGALAMKQRHSCEPSRLAKFASVDNRTRIYDFCQAIYRNMRLAEEVVRTCREAARKTPSQMVPALIEFDQYGEVTVSKQRDVIRLTPEMAESIFVLSRVTGDPLYRDLAWEMAQAIDSNFRTATGGYSSWCTSQQLSGLHPMLSNDYQPPSFIGGTLKYLYLTLAPEELPLDQWVFNAVGQPLPICGHNGDRNSRPMTKCN